MSNPRTGILAPHVLLVAAVAGGLGLATATAGVQDGGRQEDASARCSVDLSNPGSMKDIVSNALVLGLERRESEVSAFLVNAESTYATGEELLRAAAAHFGLEEATLSARVAEFEHCNCTHGPLSGERAAADASPDEETIPGRIVVSPFARDVTLHVVLHELGHALVREFDLPVLGNEETLADAFATHYLTTYLPDRAPDVLAARVRSLMIEAREVPREEWDVRGEHDSDARRAFQIAALALAADAERYAPLAAMLEMSEREVRRCRDYGSEIHRSWRRVLRPLWMPAGVPSSEWRLSYDEESDLFGPLCGEGLADELRSVLRRFDWHSQVEVAFEEGEGTASWSRSGRRVTVRGDYIRRFVAQGQAANGR